MKKEIKKNKNARWSIAQKFEVLWWKRYLADTDKAAYLANKKSYWQRFLKEAGVMLPSGNISILDAGGGPAGIYILFDTNAVTMCDPLLDEYSKKIPHFNAADYPNVRFINSKIEEFKPGCKYDLVFCLNVINHVDDIQVAINRLIELTNDGGMIMIAVDCHNYGWLRKLFGLFQFDVLHPHQYTGSEYMDMFSSSGLELMNRHIHKREPIFSYVSFVFRK